MESQMNAFNDALWAGLKGTPYESEPKIPSREGVTSQNMSLPKIAAH